MRSALPFTTYLKPSAIPDKNEVLLALLLFRIWEVVLTYCGDKEWDGINEHTIFEAEFLELQIREKIEYLRQQLLQVF